MTLHAEWTNGSKVILPKGSKVMLLSTKKMDMYCIITDYSIEFKAGELISAPDDTGKRQYIYQFNKSIMRGLYFIGGYSWYV